MSFKKIVCLHFLLILTVWSSHAQKLYFAPYDSLRVFLGNEILAHPMSGGLHSPQVNTMDLNGDSIPDLVVFDKLSTQVSCFIRDQQGRTTYVPELEYFFPNVTGWMVLADFNDDGKTDLFANNEEIVSTVDVYQNIGTNQLPRWKKIKSQLKSCNADCNSGFGSPKPITSGYYNYPSITDIDGDGDLDFLTYNGSSGFGLELHKNMSIERYGVIDSLEYTLHTACWGAFSIGFDCSDLFTLNQPCSSFWGGISDQARQMHNGCTLAHVDLYNNGTKHLLMGDVECRSLYTLTYSGSPIRPTVTGVRSDLFRPATDSLPKFPLAHVFDINLDGRTDVLITSNQIETNIQTNNPTKSAFAFMQQSDGSFTPESKTYLQSDMLDLGMSASPLAIDIQGDGKQDLLVASNMQYLYGNNYSTIHVYTNVDNETLSLTSTNFGNLALLQWSSMQLQSADLNIDGKPDLIIKAINSSQAVILRVYWGQHTQYLSPDFTQPYDIFPNIQEIEQVFFFPWDSDSLPDMLLGHRFGGLDFWKNVGTANQPNFVQTQRNIAGLGTNLNRQRLRFSIGNITHPDTLDMATIDDSGKLRIYRNIKKGTLLPEPDTFIVYNAMAQLANQTQFGFSNLLCFADFDGDTLHDILIGTAAGGVKHLKNLRKKLSQVNIPDDSTQIPKPPIPVVKSLPDLLDCMCTVFPNPTDGEIRIDCGSNLGEPIGIEITTLQGNTVTSQWHKHTQAISLHTMPSGIYIVHITIKNQRKTIKLIKN